MYLSSSLPSDVITCSITNEDHHKPAIATVYFYIAQHILIWKLSAEYGQDGEGPQAKSVLHLEQPTKDSWEPSAKNCQGLRFQSVWVTCSSIWLARLW